MERVSRKTGKDVPLDAGPDWALRPPVVPRRDFKQNVRSTSEGVGSVALQDSFMKAFDGQHDVSGGGSMKKLKTRPPKTEADKAFDSVVAALSAVKRFEESATDLCWVMQWGAA